jgi:hypothetical protein
MPDLCYGHLLFQSPADGAATLSIQQDGQVDELPRHVVESSSFLLHLNKNAHFSFLLHVYGRIGAVPWFE